MRKDLVLNGHAYTLHTAFMDTKAGAIIEASRYVNWGLDFFHGSDSTTVTVFLVAKERVPAFVQQLEKIMQSLEDKPVRKDSSHHLFELTECFNFAVLHKDTQTNPFDFFVTNFMFEWCPELKDMANTLHALSSFVLSAGADCGDASVEDYARAYLVSRGMLVPDDDEGSGLDENFAFNELIPIFNVPAEIILPHFVNTYFKHIPGPTGLQYEPREALFKVAQQLQS